MLASPVVLHAVLAGTPIALASGLVGYFLVLRAQVFAGDALSHVAFTGAMAAAAAGVSPELGLFAATALAGVVLVRLRARNGGEDAATGVVLAWVLGLGLLLLHLADRQGSGDGLIGARALFGSIFGLSAGQAWLAAGVGVGVALALLAIARPLLFASVDPAVAAARGVRVGRLALALLGLTALVTAEATRAIGALLLLGLLCAPAGTAMLLTANPYRAMALSGGLAVLGTWAGILLAYAVPALAPGPAIVLLLTAVYALVLLARGVRRQARSPQRLRSGAA